MQPEFEVEAIVEKKLIDDRIHYLVKWLHYSSEENTWEPEEHLTECKELIKQFEQPPPPPQPTEQKQEQEEDLTFVQPLNQICQLLKCYECNCVLDYNARTHQCGVSRCGVCIEAEPLECSCSDEESKATDWRPLPKEVKNQVNALEVYCPNKCHGCTRMKRMGELQQHLDTTCLFTAVCDVCSCFVNKNQLQQHMRDVCVMRQVECHWCKEMGMAKEIDEHEKDLKLCLKKLGGNVLEHPLVKGSSNKRKTISIEEFIVDDNYQERESKRQIAKEYEQWKAAKRGRIE